MASKGSCAQREQRCGSATSRGTASGGNVHGPLSIRCYSIQLVDDELGNMSEFTLPYHCCKQCKQHLLAAANSI